MTPAKALRALSRPFSPQTVFYDFLVPSLARVASRTITTSSASPSTEPQPQSLNSTSSAKRRRPLSKEQQDFLDSAVSKPRFSPRSTKCHPSDNHPNAAPSQSSWRARRNPHLHSANPTSRPRPSPPSAPPKTHVRPRGRTLPNLQCASRQAPHPTHCHDPTLDRRIHIFGLVDWLDGPKGGNGMHGGGGDRDRRAL